MDKDIILKEIIFDVSDEIGTDISYISTNQNGYQYLTGMDFGMILATGISSTFFIPFITAFANKLGEELANTVIEQLKKIAVRVKKQLQERDTNSEIITEFINIVPNEIFSTAQPALIDYEQEAVKSKQIDAVQKFLESSSFPNEKARLLAEQVYDIMNDALTDAIDEGE